MKIKVKTGQKEDKIVDMGSYFLVNIKERPEYGKANLAILKLFKKELKKNIRIVSGFKSKEKIIEILY